MTDDDIARLRGLAQAAPLGPWHAPGLAEVHDETHRVIAMCMDVDPVPDEDRPVPDVEEGDRIAAYIAAASPDVLLALLDERDALRRERDEAQRDARELRFLWEQRGERANKAEDERDAAMALLRECDEVATSLCGVADLVKHGDLFARIDAILGGDKGA